MVAFSGGGDDLPHLFFDMFSKFTIVTIAAGFISYLYTSIVLMVLARKTKTSGSGLAWFPVINFFLMCSIGRRSPIWAFLMLIPGINLIAFIVIWMSIAETRGKLPFLGALLIVPPLGMFIPLYLAMGRVTDPDTQETPGVPNRRSSLGLMVFAGVAALLIVGVLSGIVGWYAFGQPIAYTPPARKTPQIPAALAGILQEFPVDTGSRSTHPTQVITQVFDEVGASSSGDGKYESPKLGTDQYGTPKYGETAGETRTVAIPENRLPPGLKKKDLPKLGSSVTSAIYSNNNPSRSNSGGNTPDDTVFVTSIASTPGQAAAGPEIVRSIVRDTYAQPMDVTTRNSNGSVYRGSLIETSTIKVYVMVNAFSNSTIIVYAPSARSKDAAKRLAGNLGNGSKQAYSEITEGLRTLPAVLPEDLRLQETQTIDPAEFGFSLNDLPPEGRQVIAQLSAFVPERMTFSRYHDRAKHDWNIAVFDCGSGRRALNGWLFFRWTFGASEMTAIDVHGGEGRYVELEKDSILLFHKGPYIVLISVPKTVSKQRMIALGNAFQM